MHVTAGEIVQTDASRRWQVDVSTIIGIRRTALAALARTPGRPTTRRDGQP